MKVTVLVVDDDQAILDLIQLTLEDEGYRVVTSVDGAALATAHQRRTDLILLDIWMPAMNGIEVSQRLRADPATAPTPVVAMSANRTLTAPSVDLLVNDRLPKPFDRDVLVALVARWVPACSEAEVAAAVRGARQGAISNWGKRGRVASRPGPYGQLVRLEDVQAMAAEHGLSSAAPRHPRTEPEEMP